MIRAYDWKPKSLLETCMRCEESLVHRHRRAWTSNTTTPLSPSGHKRGPQPRYVSPSGPPHPPSLSLHQDGT